MAAAKHSTHALIHQLSARLTRQARRLLTLLVLVTVFITALVLLHEDSRRYIQDAVWPVIRQPILWGLGYTRYNFKPTVDEVQCYDGTIERHNAPGLSGSIPRIVHFVWGTDENSGISFSLYLAVRAAMHNLRPDDVRLHFSWLDQTSPLLQELVADFNLTLVHHAPDSYLGRFAAGNSFTWDAAHKSDVLRLQVLATEGGIYLDHDAIPLRSMDRLLQGRRDVVMAHEGGNRLGLTNAVILAKPNAPFITRWLDAYDDFDDKNWNYHSVTLPQKMSREHPTELCALSPSAFYWPMWTEGHIDWMHQRLNVAEAVEVERLLDENDGALFEDQLVYHIWSHGAKDYLARMDQTTIHLEDTRFNLMMRRILH